MAIVAVGSDHAGYVLKDHLACELRNLGHEVLDLGVHSTDRVDYPDYGAAVGQAVAGGEVELGVCVCGSGIGIAIAANKVPGVRAATVHDATSARLARQHNDANVLCIGERLTGPEVATEALRAWLGAEFEGGRHADRIKKLSGMDGSLSQLPVD
ncbi:MAG: ribose 5-phosphate isomerase B [Acidimicrobiales bacterium]|nr:ribose 5-phosphate isomerase B [Acidimicrobiales bacterium]